VRVVTYMYLKISCFSDADYADDVAAMEYDPTDSARSLKNIEAASSELGLHIPWARTKVQKLCAGPQGSRPLDQWPQCSFR